MTARSTEKKVSARSKQSTAVVDHSHTNTHSHSHALKIKIDDLKTFKPLTLNQELFFEAYNAGDYFIALHGVAGTGKCIGEDEEVNLLVSDEIYKKLLSFTTT